jgi:hypothetical protein
MARTIAPGRIAAIVPTAMAAGVVDVASGAADVVAAEIAQRDRIAGHAPIAATVGIVARTSIVMNRATSVAHRRSSS